MLDLSKVIKRSHKAQQGHTTAVGLMLLVQEINLMGLDSAGMNLDDS
jgi:hypothetical protein